jgi:AcrR family transcriptional regulator
MARGDRTRAALVSAAQESILANGVDGVTVADVLARAGQKNGGAIHYHFGSVDGLWDAVIDAHQGELDARRMARLETEGDDLDAEGIVRIIVETMAESLGSAAGRAFLAVRAHRFDLGTNRSAPSMQRLRGQLFARLSTSGHRSGPGRSAIATTLVVRTFGDLARRESVPDDEIAETVDALVDAVTALLEVQRNSDVTKEDVS